MSTGLGHANLPRAAAAILEPRFYGWFRLKPHEILITTTAVDSFVRFDTRVTSTVSEHLVLSMG